MWLYQNEFKFMAFDNDVKLLFRFDTISQCVLSKAFNVQIVRAGRWHWQNLMQWCSLVTQYGRYAYEYGGKARGRRHVADLTDAAKIWHSFRWNWPGTDDIGMMDSRRRFGAKHKEWLVDY